jgi:hypothetical protein
MNIVLLLIITNAITAVLLVRKYIVDYREDKNKNDLPYDDYQDDTNGALRF